MSNLCHFCDSPDVAATAFDEKMAIGRRRVSVSGLTKTVCHSCNEEYVTEEQAALNHALYEEATRTASEGITVGHLRSFRARWNLTQRAASALFGAGESSFAKWEAGQLPSGPAALLLQCAAHVPGVTEYLARLQKATLPGCPELAPWRTASGEVSGVLPSYVGIVPSRTSAPQQIPLPVLAEFAYQPDVETLYGKAA